MHWVRDCGRQCTKYKIFLAKMNLHALLERTPQKEAVVFLNTQA